MPDQSGNKLYACETCVRDLRLVPGQSSRGQELIDALRSSLQQEPPSAPDFAVRVVSCLNGCLNPCNIALRCRGKYSLRFSRLTPQDAAAVLSFARLYAASADGNIAPQQWPEVLRGKMTVCIPPYG
jgi:predicted metal-binding protein